MDWSKWKELLTGSFARIRAVTEQAAAMMPAEHQDFRPWDGAMSFRELVIHIATGQKALLAAALGRPLSPEQKPNPRITPTLAAARELLASATAEWNAVVPNLTPEQLAAEVANPKGTKMPAFRLLGLIRAHEIHHRGQMYVYLRMCGVKPPDAAF